MTKAEMENKPRVEMPDRAMSFETAKAAGIAVKSINGDNIILTITQQISTKLKQTPTGELFITIQLGGQWRDIYIKFPRKRARGADR